MTELETRIREALRADEIEYHDLRQPTLRDTAPRSPRTTWLIAAVAAVAVVALAVTLVLSSSNPRRQAADGLAAYAGYTWTVTGLTDAKGTISLPSDSITVSFGPDEITAGGTGDGEQIYAHYVPTASGLTVTDPGASISNQQRAAARAGRALIRLFFHVDGRNIDPSVPVRLRASVTGDTLVLRTGGATATLRRSGPAHISPILAAVGWSWRLTEVADGSTVTAVSQQRAVVAFVPDGMIIGNDTVHEESAKFAPTDDGFAAFGVIASANGQTGAASAAETAIRSLFPSARTTYAAHVDGTTLTVTSGPSTLTFAREQKIAFDGMVSSSASVTSTVVKGPTTSPGVINDRLVGPWTWEVVSVIDAKGTHTLTSPASLRFSADGYVSGGDTEQGFIDQYRVDSMDSLRLTPVHNGTRSGSGYPDERAKRVIDTMFIRESGRLPSVRVQVDGRRLTLTALGVTLVLHRE